MVDKPTTVPIGDLLKLKDKADILQKKLHQAEDKIITLETSNSQYEAQLKTAKANLEDDDEVKEVRAYLLKMDEDLAKKGEEIKRNGIAHTTRERAVRAKELKLDYKSKGLELEEEALIGAEDMEKFVTDRYVEFQAKEIEGLKKNPSNPSETVFESGAGSVVKKSPMQMTDQEFEKHWQGQKAEALSKK